MGLGTGVPWMGGDGHGEPRGDTLEGGKPEKRPTRTLMFKSWNDYYYFLTVLGIYL